ncbi:MAG: hypothetical protein ACFFD4_32125, partial [Candidatus Odinarchaeota archaeon]
LKQRLEKEKSPFSPPIKKFKPLFPRKVAGKGIFGYIEIEWPKDAYYKMTSNPVTAYTALSTTGSRTKKKQELKFAIDVAMAKKGVSRIPLYINLSKLKGNINIQLELRTATNEVILTHEFDVDRQVKREGLIVDEKDFYITGRYGQVELVFKGLGRVNNKKKDVKGKMRLFLASQTLPRAEELYETKFKVKERESLEIAQTVDLDPTFHRSLFWVVSEIVTGGIASYNAIKVDPIDQVIIDWDYLSRDEPDLKNGLEPKTKYNLDFLFHFNKFIPAPIQIEIFVTTFPEGRTKRIAIAKLDNDVNMGDDYAIEEVSIKTPKKIGYMYFSVDVNLKRGELPAEFLTEPIGVPRLQ